MSFFTLGCTQFQLLNATIPSCGYRLTSDVPYGSQTRQKLDVYVPTKPAPGAPVVIFFYGGGWVAYDKADFRFAAEALTSRGFVAILPSYRLYPDVTFPAFVEDGASAVRWAHDNAATYAGNPDRIYLMGHSSGGYIAAMLTTDAHYLKAVGLDRSAIRATAALSAPLDFTPRPIDLPIFSMAPGQSPNPNIEPISFIDPHEPPMLLITGLADTVVDPGNSLRMAQRIHAIGGQSQYIAYPRLGHAPVVLSLAWPFRWLAPTLRDTATFFKSH
jgi:acetyl esterase/lipase